MDKDEIVAMIEQEIEVAGRIWNAQERDLQLAVGTHRSEAMIRASSTIHAVRMERMILIKIWEKATGGTWENGE